MAQHIVGNTNDSTKFRMLPIGLSTIMDESTAGREALNLEDLRNTIRAFSKERDGQQFRFPKNLAMALSVEVAEIVEHFQWRTEKQSQNLPPEKLAEVREVEREGEPNERRAHRTWRPGQPSGGSVAHRADYLSLFLCPFYYNTILQHYRLLYVTTNVTSFVF
jgi:hypothetical protein